MGNTAQKTDVPIANPFQVSGIPQHILDHLRQEAAKFGVNSNAGAIRWASIEFYRHLIEQDQKSEPAPTASV